MQERLLGPPGAPRNRFKRVLMVAAMAELAWLVVINAALWVPFTQTLVNKIRPEKFHVRWASAWSLYPGQVSVSGAFANGQSPTQQWQVEVDRVSGHLWLLPLIFKRVWISGAEAENVEFRLRPRLKPGRDYSAALPYFPEIEGWDMTAATQPVSKKRPWLIVADDLEVSGQLSYWIWNVEGAASGALDGRLTYAAPGGDLSLDTDLDLTFFETAHLNGDYELFRRGSIRGSLGFAPFNPRANKGLPMLDYLLLDTVADLDLNSLAFINVFLLNFEGTRIGGSGLVAGRLHFERGRVVDGTDLAVQAQDLAVTVQALDIVGEGGVHLAMGPATDGQLNLAVDYTDLQVIHAEDTTPTLTGQGLSLEFEGDGHVLAQPEQYGESRSLTVRLDDLEVPDLASLQRYVPAKWPLQVLGGEGRLSGGASLTPTSLGVDLSVTSGEAELAVRQYRFETDLDARLVLHNPSITEQPTRVSGTYVKLSDSQLEREGAAAAEGWQSHFLIKDGNLSLLGDRQRASGASMLDLFQLLGETRAEELLGQSTGSFEFESRLSSLAWLGVLFQDQYQAQVAGQGSVQGLAVLESGLPAPGTEIRIDSGDLQVRILDYLSRGAGQVRLGVQAGGEYPDWNVGVDLRGGDLRRPGEDVAYIQDVEMRLEALIEDVSFEPERRPEFSLKYRIPSARVTDMSVFNHLQPPDAPVRLAGGTASLGADILLQPRDTDGWLKLAADGAQFEGDGQTFTGDLQADIQLAGGEPAEMTFNFSGSRLRLDQVRVAGETSAFDDDEWSLTLTVPTGETTYADPLRLEADLELHMSDTRPLVALFRNQDGWRPKFLAEMLTIDDIRGTAQLKIEAERLFIPHSGLLGEDLEILARGEFDSQTGTGMVYARYRKLDAVVEFEEARRNLDLIRARQKFDAYRIQHR